MADSGEKTYRQFLVLGIGVQVDESSPDQASVSLGSADKSSQAYYSLRKMADAPEPKGMLARSLWVIHIRNGGPLREAYHYAHGIVSLALIVPFCIAASIDDLVHIIPYPESMASGSTRRVSANDLVEELECELYFLFGGEDLFRLAYRTCKIESYDRAEEIAVYLQRYSSSDDFARACSYLHLSITELGIDVCDWGQEDFDQSFLRYVSVSRAESAFLNAFKVIESIVGEPSKNRTEGKLRIKLQARGINPDELVGFRHEMSVLDRILLYHPLRDRIAAHGIGKVKRDLRLSEIIELQALARFMLLHPQST